jgi:hypothetical protein
VTGVVPPPVAPARLRPLAVGWAMVTLAVAGLATVVAIDRAKR